MSEANNQALASFLSDWLATVEPLPSAIVLAHVRDGTAPTVLDTVELGTLRKKKKSAKANGAAELATRIEAGGQAHADAQGTAGRYTVAVMQGARVLAQRLLRFEPTLGLGVSGPNGEPSDKYLMRYGLRHIERMADYHEGGIGAVFVALARLNEAVSAENERYRRADLQRTTLLQELLDRRAEREREDRAADKQEERMDQGIALLADVAKVVVGKMSGADLITSVLKKLSVEQFQAMAAMLDDEGKEALGQALRIAEQSEVGQQGMLGLLQPSQAIERALPEGAEGGPDDE